MDNISIMNLNLSRAYGNLQINGYSTTRSRSLSSRLMFFLSFTNVKLTLETDIVLCTIRIYYKSELTKKKVQFLQGLIAILTDTNLNGLLISVITH